MAVSGLSCSMWHLSLWRTGCLLRHVGFSLVAACGLSSCGRWAPECMGSVVVARGLSCPTACGILVTQPGIGPTSLALEGGFLTAGPPGKSCPFSFLIFLRGSSLFSLISLVKSLSTFLSFQRTNS